ncbi:hypothetical protein [Bradyrhizobium sp. STM 3809]|uniref:hypothetical protein n=1 Tax=Bradyrhizobium sp. STM 3809 TaxID=551936 RepID=UPI001111B162|nr:hypothetical protein [Bradyrhizobium sp. STM 3809]
MSDPRPHISSWALEVFLDSFYRIRRAPRAASRTARALIKNPRRSRLLRAASIIDAGAGRHRFPEGIENRHNPLPVGSLM